MRRTDRGGGEGDDVEAGGGGGREGRGGKEEAFFNGIMGGFSIYVYLPMFERTPVAP